MGILNWFRGTGSKATEKEPGRSNLAFVLLSDAKLPIPSDVVRAFASFGAPDESLLYESDSDKTDVLCLRLNSGGFCMVALMPVPVPNGEADNAAKFSLSSFRDGWKLPPHLSHLIVTFRDRPEVAPLVALSRFTSVLAAIAESSSSVGVYWGNAGATHDTEFFINIAKEQGIVPRITTWTGISVARESDGQLSLLSLGMAQLSLPNLLLVSGPENQSSAMEVMFDLLAYVADRGEPIPEGETVGRTTEQRLPVRYVPSPIDPSANVWRVELP